MMFQGNARRLAALLVISLVWAGCKRNETATTVPTPATPPPVGAAVPAFKVSAIELGTAIGADKRVSAPANVFAAGDTVYAVVATEGAAPSVTLAATWTYEDGQLVNESMQTIAPTGPSATEFHISKPDGLPAGKYKVEVKANDTPVGTKEFEVR
jgi:hypothetical protein